MKSLNKNIVDSFSSKLGVSLGATNSTPVNIATNLDGWTFECPEEPIVATRNEETTSFSVASLLLRAVLKDAINPLQLHNGQIITTVICNDVAVTPYNFVAGSVTRAVIKAMPTTPSEQLLVDIKTAFDAEIKTIQEYYNTLLKDASLQADYLKAVEEQQQLKIYAIDIDTSKTAALITSAKFSETLEQIQSVFVGTKTAVDCAVSSDSKSIACNLMQWDKNNAETILAKLATFGYKATFDKDSTKVLTRLQCQILTITL
jgi:hypothetical protein